MDILDKIGYFFTLRDLIILLVTFVVALAIVIRAIIFFFRRERRFFNNLKKKIIIFAPSKSSSKDGEKPEDMRMEMNLLKKANFFPNLPNEIFTNTSHDNLQSITKNTLVIVGYNKNFQEKSFLEILKKVRNFNVPLIVYSYSRLDGKTLDEIKKYPHHSICETGLRLVNDVFTTLATYPYGKL